MLGMRGLEITALIRALLPLLTYWTYLGTKCAHFSWDALEGMQSALELRCVSAGLLHQSPSLVS